MTRVATVLALPPDYTGRGAPPGIDPRAYAAALVEDVTDLVSGLVGVEVAVAVPASDPAWAHQVATLVWPGTTILPVHDVDDGASVPVLTALADRGAELGIVVAPDVPDLPPLVLAKLLRGLGDAAVAVAPADAGLAALASRLPLPAWLREHGGSLDTLHPVRTLRALAAPDPVALAPRWHRLRRPGDVRRLDPGLEGWEATRRLLSGAGRKP